MINKKAFCSTYSLQKLLTDSIPETRNSVSKLPVASCVPFKSFDSSHKFYHFNIYETYKTFEFEIKVFAPEDTLIAIPKTATPPYVSQNRNMLFRNASVMVVADKSIMPVIETQEQDEKTCIAGYRNTDGEFIGCYQLQVIENGNTTKFKMQIVK